MRIDELAASVHKCSVNHGEWDGERNIYQVLAMIHTEWSGAMEEARSGRPLKWYNCTEGDGVVNNPCYKLDPECAYAHREKCPYRQEEPRGAAVKLIDGALRILDFLAYLSADMVDPETGAPADVESLEDAAGDDVPEDLPTLICLLHSLTGETFADEERGIDFAPLIASMAAAMGWVKQQGIPPVPLLLEKLEWNEHLSFDP